MARFPEARAAEFRHAVDTAGIAAGDRVADIPCGGGYLARYLPDGVTLWSVDSSDVFADRFRAAGGRELLQCPISEVPLPDATLDHVVSLAGLHHVADRRPFWRECARLLRPGGTLTVCDVQAGSPIACFLDGVVDRHTVTGHQGIYFDAGTLAELEAAGFRVGLAAPRTVPWRAPDRLALAEFCRLLFGLEGIDAAGLLPLLERGIGVRDTPAGAELDWALMTFRATRA